MINTVIYDRDRSVSFTGKERDSETGYSYFGARYYDSDLSGLFLSVDPMADKYPSISPYAYCAWNPVKAIDPNGMDSVHTPNGMANAGEGYKTTPDGMYLYGEGLQTKKWNPDLEVGGVVGERGGYEDYSGDPDVFNTDNQNSCIPTTTDVSFAHSVIVSIPVMAGGLLSRICTTVGNAVVSATTCLWLFPACLLFSSDSSPTQKAIRGEHESNIRNSTRGKHEKANKRRIQDQQGSKGEKKVKGKRPQGYKGPWPPKNKK